MPTERYKKWAKNNPERLKELKKKYYLQNKEANNARSRARYAKNREKLKRESLDKYHRNPLILANSRLKRLYGINLEQYNAILLTQNNVCAICHKPETLLDNKQKDIRKLAVDHCHVTNKVRGLVCFRCNIILGKVNDSIELLNKLILYLKNHT